MKVEIKFIEDASFVGDAITVDPQNQTRSNFKKLIRKSEFYNSLPKNVRKTMGTRDFFVSAKLAQDYGNRAFNYFAHLKPNNVHAELACDEDFLSLPTNCQASVENYVHGYEQFAHKVYMPDVFSSPSEPAFIVNLDSANMDSDLTA